MEIFLIFCIGILCLGLISTIKTQEEIRKELEKIKIDQMELNDIASKLDSMVSNVAEQESKNDAVNEA